MTRGPPSAETSEPSSLGRRPPSYASRLSVSAMAFDGSKALVVTCARTGRAAGRPAPRRTARPAPRCPDDPARTGSAGSYRIRRGCPVFFENGGRPGQDLSRTDDVRIHHQARELLLGLLRPELEPVLVRRVVERCVARRQPEVLGPQPAPQLVHRRRRCRRLFIDDDVAFGVAQIAISVARVLLKSRKRRRGSRNRPWPSGCRSARLGVQMLSSSRGFDGWRRTRRGRLVKASARVFDVS